MECERSWNFARKRGNNIEFIIHEEDTPDKKRGGTVGIEGVAVLGTVIHLYPETFKYGREDEIHTVIHEFGRRFVGLHSESGKTVRNPDWGWDSIVGALARDIETLKKQQAEIDAARAK